MRIAALVSALMLASLVVVTQLVPDGTQPESQAIHVTAETFDELVGKSSHVVVGRYGNTRTVIEVPGTGSDGAPDNRLIGVGIVYNVEVERYLKGGGDAEIQVVQFEEYRTQEPGEAVKVQESPSASFPFQRNQRYLLFLTPQGQVRSMPDLFLGTAEPYRFKLTDGAAKADGPLADLFRGLKAERPEARFPDSSEESLLRQIETIVGRASE